MTICPTAALTIPSADTKLTKSAELISEAASFAWKYCQVTIAITVPMVTTGITAFTMVAKLRQFAKER